MFTIISKKSKTHEEKRQLRQLYCKMVLQLQKRNNFSVIPIKVQFVKLWLSHFTNQAQGDSRNGISPRNWYWMIYLSQKPNTKGFWLFWLCHNEPIQSWFMKWILIWDHDSGFVAYASSVYTPPGQSINRTNFLFCRYITLCPQLMQMKYLVDITCIFPLVAILLKIFKWLSCLYC